MCEPVLTVVIDPDGDAMITLPHPENLAADAGANEQMAVETRFKVSMKHLIMVSRAKAIFEGNYKESRPSEEDGLYRWKFEPIFDSGAFEIVMRAIHGQTMQLPKAVSLSEIAEIAAVVDDLNCHQALWFFAKAWIQDLKVSLPRKMCEDVPRWILVSSVFDEPEVFNSVTKLAILEGKGPFTSELPIWPSIIVKIDDAREVMLDLLVARLFNALQQAAQGSTTCVPECMSMTFGTLVYGMMSAKLFYPRPSRPFEDLSLLTVTNLIRGLELPTLYSQPLRGHYYMHNEGPEEDLTVSAWIISKPDRPTQSTMELYRERRTKKKKKVPHRRDVEEEHECAFQNVVEDLLINLDCDIQGLELSLFVSE